MFVTVNIFEKKKKKKRDRGTIVFTTALLSVPSLYVSSTTIDNRYHVFFQRSSAEFDTSHPTSTAVLYCTVLGHVYVTFVIHAALSLIPELVYPHVFAHTSRTSSCLLASKIGKRQNGMFSDLAPRPSRTQPPCASNELHKHRSTIGRRDNSVITRTQEKSWGVTHGVKTVPTI